MSVLTNKGLAIKVHLQISQAVNEVSVRSKKKVNEVPLFVCELVHWESCDCSKFNLKLQTEIIDHNISRLNVSDFPVESALVIFPESHELSPPASTFNTFFSFLFFFSYSGLFPLTS